MSATLLTLAILSAGSLEDRCHWIPAYSVVPHRMPAMTVVRKPLQIVKPGPSTKRLRGPRVAWAYECDESGALRDAGPTLLPPVVAAVEDLPAIAAAPPSDAYAIPAFDAPSAGVPVEEGAPPLFTLGAPVVVLGGGYLMTAAPVAAIPEPATAALLLAGIAALAIRRATTRRTA